MILPAIAVLALLLQGAPAQSVASAQAGDPAIAKVVTTDFHPERPNQFPTWQAESEQRLLELTNAERSTHGLTPLRMDPALSAAARQHSSAMAAQRDLSHQLPGEAPLAERVATPALHLASAGENVALDVDIDQAHDALMHSPPHRENILRGDYNVVGFGVARVGDRIFVTEDFGRKVALVSAEQAEHMVASAIALRRKESRRGQLRQLQLGSLRGAACSMANQDQVNPAGVHGLGPMRYVLTYTDMQPNQLPKSAQKPMQDSHLRSFAVGTCYAQTPSYPNGAYWITVAFY